jgi:hypothetical protein
VTSYQLLLLSKGCPCVSMAPADDENQNRNFDNQENKKSHKIFSCLLF